MAVTLVAVVLVSTAHAAAAGTRRDGDYERENVIVADVEPEVDDVSHVAAGPNGTIWFTCTDGDRIGRIDPSGNVTTFKDPRGNVIFPQGITAGADGNMWLVSFDNDRIGRITPTGQVKTFAVPPHRVLLGGITTGPDGNVWFTMRNAIGRITPSGDISVFESPGVEIDVANAITTGPDGNLWFTSYAWKDRHHGTRNQIGRITPAGEIRMFSDPGGRVRSPGGITTGADGNVWFVSHDNNRIGRITPAGAITTFRVPRSSLRGLESITGGPDGNLWFTSTMNSKVGRITPTGDITGFDDVNVVLSNDAGIATGADGNLWVAEYYAVTRVTPGGVFTRFPQ